MALRTKTTALLVGLFFLLHTWRAKAQVTVTMEDRVDVQRGEDANMSCLYTSGDDGIGGLTIEWFYQQLPTGQRHKIYFQDAMGHREDPGTPFAGRLKVDVASKGSGQVTLTILQTTLWDEADFICRVRSLVEGSQEGVTQLKVFETPSFPTIEAVNTGIWYHESEPSKIGSCETKNGYPRPNITWFRDGSPLVNVPNEVLVLPQVTRDSSGLYSVRSDLSLKVVKKDKDSMFSCEVNYWTPGGQGMLESEKIQVQVTYPTDEVSFWVVQSGDASPKAYIKEGDTVQLQCQGNGNPQPKFDFRYGVKLLEVQEQEAQSGVLTLREVRRFQSGLYECITLNTESYEEVVANTSLLIHYLDPVEVSPSHTLVALQGGEVNASCNALSSLHTRTVWTKVWKKSGLYYSTNNILSLSDIMYNMAGTYECIVTVPLVADMESRGTLELLVQGMPEIQEPQTTSLEKMAGSTVVLTCTARGFPTPTITWESSEVQIDSVTSNPTVDGVESVVSITVTSDLNVSCNAANDIGRAELLFFVTAITPTTDLPTTPRSTVPAMPPKETKRESNGAIIAAIIICLLLLAVLGSVLYFLYKKGKICGRSGKQDLSKEKTSRDNIVVEMKSDNTEEAVLLVVNGEKKPPGEQ